jgi:outer membrane protein, heavy metal efflux system
MRFFGTYCFMGTVAVLILAGCESYQAKPLVPSTVILNVERSRRLVRQAEVPEGAAPAESVAPEASSQLFTFARAVELTREHSPALKQVRAEYVTAQALAKVKTPFPNPAFEVGPQYGFGPDVGENNRLQPFGSLGFTIPTGKRLKRQDELNAAHAELARVETLARYREVYMTLRRSYARLVLSQKRLNARKNIAQSAEQSTALSKKLIEAGQATALDSGLVELEQARLSTAAFDAENEIAEVGGDLSEIVGVHTEFFEPMPDSSLPELPEVLPPLKELQQLMVYNHPALARLRAQYEISERQLRLEIAKQYPDFHFGPSFARDVGEKKNVIGLTLGIEIPVFDRNQQAVASAMQRREEILIKFEAAANRALAALDRAYRSFQIATEKLKILKTVVLPKAEANIGVARRSLEAGTADSLRYLETERSQRAVLIDALDTEFAARSAFIALEESVGYPLVKFPSEGIDQVPQQLPLQEVYSIEASDVIEKE